MIVQIDEGLTSDDRVRITWEGAHVATIEQSWAHNTIRFEGTLQHVPGARTDTLTVHNPERVWIQSLAPDKVRERIAGEYPNPDAVLLQTRLDAVRVENARLRAQITRMRDGYDVSKTLWRKRHRRAWWLADTTVETLPAAIERGEPDPDPLDY